MRCHRHLSLLEKYKHTVTVYAEAVFEMRRHTGDIPHNEFMVLCRLAEQARDACENARLALDGHVEHHHCHS